MSKEGKNKDNNNSKSPSLYKQADSFLANLQWVSSTEKLFFIQHLGIMIKSGISLARALETLSKQTNNKRFQKILMDVAHRVEKGQTLSESMEAYCNVFSELFINMINAGETSGKLEEVLHQLYKQMKKDHQLMAKIRGALTYPAVIFVAMVGIGIGMMVFVVPRMLDIFRDVNMELPLMTRILIVISDAISNQGIFVIIILAILIIIFWRTLKTKSGRYYWQWLMLHLPIISPIIKKINLARFARTMSSLLQTDIKIVESFNITAKTLGNVHYRESLEQAAEKIKKGEDIHKVLATYPHLYSHVILQMINVGEEISQLDKVLAEVASFYEESVQEVMDTLPSIIEPVIILVLASAIGAMAVAIIMPMYSLTNAF